MWQVTCDTWQVTHDKWQVGEANLLSKFQLPSSYCLGVEGFEDFKDMGHLASEWMTKVCVEQPRLHRVC